MDLFWVSWIEKRKSGEVCRGAVYEAYLSLEEAVKKEVHGREKMYGENLIAIWVERHNSAGERIDIPFHRCYVDAFGERERIRRPVVVKCKDDHGNVVEFRYDSVEKLKAEYWSDNIDMNVPANDAVVVFASLDGVPLENVTDFESVVNALGIGKKGES